MKIGFHWGIFRAPSGEPVTLFSSRKVVVGFVRTAAYFWVRVQSGEETRSSSLKVASTCIVCLLWFYWQQILCVHWTDEERRRNARMAKIKHEFKPRSMGYLGICSAISSKLSLGFIGVFSNSLDGAVRCVLKSERLTRLNTFAPRRCRNSIFFFFLFASSRCKLWRRKKNIDILHVRLDCRRRRREQGEIKIDS